MVLLIMMKTKLNRSYMIFERLAFLPQLTPSASSRWCLSCIIITFRVKHPIFLFEMYKSLFNRTYLSPEGISKTPDSPLNHLDEDISSLLCLQPDMSFVQCRQKVSVIIRHICPYLCKILFLIFPYKVMNIFLLRYIILILLDRKI